MEQLDAYIAQARKTGQTDEQIRQALTTAGWNPEQVNNALGSGPVAVAAPIVVSGDQPPNPATTQPKPAKKRHKLLIVIAGLAALLVVSGAVYALTTRQTSYQTVIQQFITAMQTKDKNKADSLESPAFQASVKKLGKSSSFYALCQQSKQLCTPFFATSFINKATKTYKNYKADNGVEGKEIVYTIKQSANGKQAGGQGCSSNSTTSLVIGVIPKGKSWLVDTANPSLNFDANLCSAGGSTSSQTASTSQSNNEPTNDATQQAQSDIDAIQTDLEAYNSQNGYYPSDIQYSNFAGLGADSSSFNPPPGIHFVYTPSPSGCTTASQNCQSYTLSANDASNNVVAGPVQSLQ